MAKSALARRPGLAATAIILVSLGATLSAQAALPPYFARQAELQSILASGEVQERLQDQEIDAIERVGADLYQVRAGECLLEVRIVDDPSAEPIPGPRAFLLEVGEAVCR